ncbi:unnamed protein product [Acanthosepion pharaonis]|uniref:Uncharacterized protein n=1 Tax=Acanthosepion pharaonis TaxID=158019 RepID=A0A812E522_ACAPH|nr:unnamed protein product [Sepia pharaonis]
MTSLQKQQSPKQQSPPQERPEKQKQHKEVHRKEAPHLGADWALASTRASPYSALFSHLLVLKSSLSSSSSPLPLFNDEAFPPTPYRGPVDATPQRPAVAIVGTPLPGVEVLAAVAAPAASAAVANLTAATAVLATVLAAALAASAFSCLSADLVVFLCLFLPLFSSVSVVLFLFFLYSYTYKYKQNICIHSHYLSIYLSIYLSMYLSIYLSIYVSIYLSIYVILIYRR